MKQHSLRIQLNLQGVPLYLCGAKFLVLRIHYMNDIVQYYITYYIIWRQRRYVIRVCIIYLFPSFLSSLSQEAIMKAEEKGSHKERVEAMQKKFDVSTHTHTPIPPMNTYIVHIRIFVHTNEIVLCTNRAVYYYT